MTESVGPSLLVELPVLVGILQAGTGEDDGWAAGVTPDARLSDDLQLDSLEWATIADLLRERFGAPVDLVGYVAGLGIDELLELRVGDVLTYLSTCVAERR